MTININALPDTEKLLESINLFNTIIAKPISGYQLADQLSDEDTDWLKNTLAILQTILTVTMPIVEEIRKEADAGVILIGGTGAITLSDGGDGNDLIYADATAPEADILVGGSGNDILYGYDGNNLLTGGDGTDLLYGGNDIDNLVGGTGNDIIEGAGGVDVLVGNEDNDILNGDADDDALEGGTGADRLQGGAGLDKYLYRQDDFGTDTIIDSDGQGSILLGTYTLSIGDYNEEGRFWNSSNGQYEIRNSMITLC